MKLSVNNILMLFLITLLGVAGSVVVGLMMYGSGVFDTKSVGFSFLAYGLSGALIFAFYHVRGLSEAITAAVAVCRMGDPSLTHASPSPHSQVVARMIQAISGGFE